MFWISIPSHQQAFWGICRKSSFQSQWDMGNKYMGRDSPSQKGLENNSEIYRLVHRYEACMPAWETHHRSVYPGHLSFGRFVGFEVDCALSEAFHLSFLCNLVRAFLFQ